MLLLTYTPPEKRGLPKYPTITLENIRAEIERANKWRQENPDLDAMLKYSSWLADYPRPLNPQPLSPVITRLIERLREIAIEQNIAFITASRPSKRDFLESEPGRMFVVKKHYFIEK